MPAIRELAGQEFRQKGGKPFTSQCLLPAVAVRGTLTQIPLYCGCGDVDSPILAGTTLYHPWKSRRYTSSPGNPSRRAASGTVNCASVGTTEATLLRSIVVVVK
ncbi:hypothetical protein BH24ACT14_BH24ACT14_02100 [soil metagenome]